MARPIRYAFIIVVVATGAALSALGGWRYARTSAPVNGPIILISIDSLRPDHLPAYGYRKVATPSIDALAADGVLFERAYSHVPQTLPAHVSLLSGRLPFDTGVRDDVGFVVGKNERMLAEMLRDRGYATAGVVSTFLLRRETGIDRGFTFFDAELPDGPPESALQRLERDGSDSEQVAERWLESAGTSRLFLFLQINGPHSPYTPPARFAGGDPYDGEIAYADEVVGKLVGYLKAHQIYDRSTIVLVSDHGEGLGTHGEQGHGLLLYNDAIHVPLIVKQMSGEGAGRSVKDVVQHVDLVPTVLDFAKAPIPGNLAGRSLKPLLDGGGKLPDRTVYFESLYGRYHFGWSVLKGVTDGSFQLIKSAESELYDLTRDAGEQHNLAGEGGTRERRLREELERLAADVRVSTPSEVTPADQARFEALGNVGWAPRADCEKCPAPDAKVVGTYRSAIDLAVARRYRDAFDMMQRLVREAPELADAWRQLAAAAFRVGNYDSAVDAYKHAASLDTTDPLAHLDAVQPLLRLHKMDEARREAAAALELAPEKAGTLRAEAHQWLARIALARRDRETARSEAARAEEENPPVPAVAYIEGRISYDAGQHANAFNEFEAALAKVAGAPAAQIPDLHAYAADCLVKLDRGIEAESEYLEEVKYFPQTIRAWVGLATLYHAMDRQDEAAEVLEKLVRLNQTSEAYLAAARVWTTFGDRRRAQALRAEASRPAASVPRSK